MKYSKNLSIYLAVLVGIILIAMAENFGDNPDNQVKAKTVQGKDTLITVKK
jgi:hypothetical protein